MQDGDYWKETRKEEQIEVNHEWLDGNNSARVGDYSGQLFFFFAKLIMNNHGNIQMVVDDCRSA